MTEKLPEVRRQRAINEAMNPVGLDLIAYRVLVVDHRFAVPRGDVKNEDASHAGSVIASENASCLPVGWVAVRKIRSVYLGLNICASPKIM